MVVKVAQSNYNREKRSSQTGEETVNSLASRYPSKLLGFLGFSAPV
jgi:hypothetical protein